MTPLPALPGRAPGRADPGHSYPEVMARGVSVGAGKRRGRQGRQNLVVRSHVLHAQKFGLGPEDNGE